MYQNEAKHYKFLANNSIAKILQFLSPGFLSRRIRNPVKRSKKYSHTEKREATSKPRTSKEKVSYLFQRPETWNPCNVKHDQACFLRSQERKAKSDSLIPLFGPSAFVPSITEISNWHLNTNGKRTKVANTKQQRSQKIAAEAWIRPPYTQFCSAIEERIQYSPEIPRFHVLRSRWVRIQSRRRNREIIDNVCAMPLLRVYSTESSPRLLQIIIKSMCTLNIIALDHT